MAPVDGDSTASIIKNPWAGDRTTVQLVWHPDHMVREEAELRLLERLGQVEGRS